MPRLSSSRRRPSSWFVLHVAAAMLASASVGCSDSGPTGEGQSIQLALVPGELPVQPGSTGSAIATLTRVGGYRGAVSLALSGLPTGVTATFTPAELSGAVSSATVAIAVAASVAPGSYTATLGATGRGVSEVTTPLKLSVTVPPAYTMTLDPAALPVVAGGSGTATVVIDRTNFAGGIALALVSPPAGISGAFNATPTTTNASALVLSVASGVAPGTYPLTIEGTAAGLPARQAALTLAVLPANASQQVEFQFCDESGPPAFFAYQDGSGAWQAVPGSASGGVTKYAFNQTQGWGGVLVVFRSEAESGFAAAKAGFERRFGAERAALRPVNAGRVVDAAARLQARSRADLYETYLLLGATAELASEGVDDCAQYVPTRTVQGTVAGVPDLAYARISFGGSTRIFQGGVSTGPLTFSDVPARPTDLVGSRLLTPGSAPDRIVVMRNLDVPDGGSLPAAIDFAGPSSASPAVANVTVTGGGGDDLEAYTDVFTSNAHVGLWADLAPSPATVRPWAGLRPETMLAGDFHALMVFASGDGPSTFRVATRFVEHIGDQAIALGPALGATSTSLAAPGAYPRFRFQGPLPPEYHKAAFIEVYPESDGNYYLVLATRLFLAAAGSALGYDITMPDVAGLPGFPAAARLTVGNNTVLVSAVGFNSAGVYEVRPSPGNQSREAYRSSTIVVQ